MLRCSSEFIFKTWLGVNSFFLMYGKRFEQRIFLRSSDQNPKPFKDILFIIYCGRFESVCKRPGKSSLLPNMDYNMWSVQFLWDEGFKNIMGYV